MKVILFGATGMVGQGVLRECFLDPDVQDILSIGRAASPLNNPKLRELLQPDLFDLSSLEPKLVGFDACFFCLGVSSAGMKEATYKHWTYDLTMAVAQTLVKLNPGITFIYVSGLGTDSTEKGSVMWARVKGQTENALLRLPFKAAYMFRPGAIVPLHGVRSKTRLYQMIYTAGGPLFRWLDYCFPKYATTTEKVGRAMLITAKNGAPQPIIENLDINRMAKAR